MITHRHHGALVENDVLLECEIANGFEHNLFVRLPGRDDGAADRQRVYATLTQTIDPGTALPYPLRKGTYPRVSAFLPREYGYDGNNEIGDNVSDNNNRHEPKSKVLSCINKNVKKLNHLSDAKEKP